MQMITYAGDEFLTGDEIAEALLAYSRALGEEDRAEIVGIPVRAGDGSTATARFLIGPASQIVTRTVSGHGDELEDHEVVQRLQQLTRGVEAPTSSPLEMPPGSTYDVA